MSLRHLNGGYPEIRALAIHPSGWQTAVLAATLDSPGPVAGDYPSSHGGVYKSTDGGGGIQHLEERGRGRDVRTRGQSPGRRDLSASVAEPQHRKAPDRRPAHSDPDHLGGAQPPCSTSIWRFRLRMRVFYSCKRTEACPSIRRPRSPDGG